MSTLIWEGIAIALTHHTQRFGGPFDHLELHAEERLPVTDTGYRSLFIHPDDLALWASPEAFVIEWLNGAAKEPRWRDYRQNARQLSLF